MTALILVAYATKHGSTQEVAEAIAATLREHALEVEVQPASEVRALDRYGAVLLGAPLYSGRWHGDANRFLKRHRTALSERPVAIEVFGGVIDPAKLRFPFNRMPASDARDWTAIRAWASNLATQFQPAQASASELA